MSAAAGHRRAVGLLPGFDFWAALIMGIVVGEGVSWAANMKRGPGLQMVGLAAVARGRGRQPGGAAPTGAAATRPLRAILSGIPGNDVPPARAVQPSDLRASCSYALAFGLVFYRLR